MAVDIDCKIYRAVAVGELFESDTYRLFCPCISFKFLAFRSNFSLLSLSFDIFLVSVGLLCKFHLDIFLGDKSTVGKFFVSQTLYATSLFPDFTRLFLCHSGRYIQSEGFPTGLFSILAVMYIEIE